MNININMILFKSEEVTDKIYNSKWYNADVSLQKCVIFFLARSQKNLTLKCAGYGVMSFDAFKNVTTKLNIIFFY